MWKLKADERIANWRAFRLTIGYMPFEQAVLATADYWHNCPHCAYYLDPNDPESWPTAWELLSENYYCDLAKSLGMMYTVALSGHGSDYPMELQVYQDPTTGYEYNLSVFHEGKYVINFLEGQVVNIEQVKDQFKLKRSYSKTVLKL